MNKIGSLIVLLAVEIGSAGNLFSIEKMTVSWKKKTELEKRRRGSRNYQVEETESENR